MSHTASFTWAEPSLTAPTAHDQDGERVLARHADAKHGGEAVAHVRVDAGDALQVHAGSERRHCDQERT
ncbi:MAG: hypothetical protein KAX84_06330, partial [Burkholderiales bacterium]|nr:hypothetical protein [Burkholderiales bacterium]